MAVKVLALASGVTGLADHRMLNGAMLAQGGAQAARSGVLITPGGGDLSTVSAMVARVAGIRAVVANSIASNLGPYLVVSDANTDITFDAGEASVPRVDRIIIRVRDNVNDGSGSTAGSIEYLKGQASGAATAMPNNSLLLYEMTIPAGASAGGGGVNFANAVDKRVFITVHGGIAPTATNTTMTAIPGPFHGETTYRQDFATLFSYDGSVWRPRGQISVASSSNLGDINNPWDGLQAVARDTDTLYIYNGSTWDAVASPAMAKKGIIARGRRSSSTGNITTTETGVLRLDNVPVVNGRIYKISTNGVNMDTSVDNDAATTRIRINTAGTATTSSTPVFAPLRQTIDNASQSNIVPLECFYVAGATGNISILLSMIRQTGSGNIILFASATDYLEIIVEDMGVDPGDTGVVI